MLISVEYALSNGTSSANSKLLIKIGQKIYLLEHKTNFPFSKAVLRLAGVEGLADYPEKNRTTNHDLLIRYYKGIGRHWIQRIYETYQADFDLFGYEIPPYLLTL